MPNTPSHDQIAVFIEDHSEGKKGINEWLDRNYRDGKAFNIAPAIEVQKKA
jgi:hypothetical protein